MDGIIIINKEKGLTSRDVVNLVGKKLNTRKVGHAGTLDPMATGVLVIGVGKGTKVLDLLTMDTKEYIATAKVVIKDLNMLKRVKNGNSLKLDENSLYLTILDDKFNIIAIYKKEKLEYKAFKVF